MNSDSTFPVIVHVNLRDAGLRHAPGKGGCCDGSDHGLGVDIEEPDIERIIDRYADPYTDIDDDVLQALHEQAHPDGSLYWQNCRERGCSDVI